ncbi:MAG: phospho-sugar mutase, partial [Oscillospiraceae bacterium]|nr:phospho-sugar mutase [Oscillospiraceae bacterium]
EYNGYKVYWEDGAQVGSEVSDAMTEKINAVDMFSGVKTMDFEEARTKGLIELISEEMDRKYLELVKSLAVNDGEALDKTICAVYTPLNGAGSIPVRTVLAERGFTNVHIVKEQEDPDPDFTTVGYPNPEDVKAFALSEKLGEAVGAQLLIATDPDCDRLAIELAGKGGGYIPLNGNQVGVILINYLLEGRKKAGTMPENGAMVKSIVTGDMGKAICERYGVRMFESLTGFKNICGRIPLLHELGYEYLFGYEESIGYAASEQVRDKDGVSAAMLLIEAAAFYKKQGKTLMDVLEELFKEYGYYSEGHISLVLDGVEGAERIQRMMAAYREEYPEIIGGESVAEVIDYKDGYGDIEPSNVVKFVLTDGSWYVLRPSGTEPKLKLYFYARAESAKESRAKVDMMSKAAMDRLESVG